MNENEIRDVLAEGIGEEPPTAGGPAAVFAGARARVVRTRAVTGALSVAAVLGVAAGAVAVSGGSGGVAKANQIVAPGAAKTGSTSSAPRTTPGTTTTPTTAAHGVRPGYGTGDSAPVPGPGQVLMDGRAVGEIVKSLLPAGLVTAGYSGQDGLLPARFGVRATGAMSLDDGTGRLTTVLGAVQQKQSFAFKDTNCPTEERFDPRVSDCQSSAQQDGSVILTYRENDYVPGTNGQTKGSYSFVALRAFPDGMAVEVRASNYFDPPNDPHQKGWHISPSRPDPLLTMDQLKAMLMDSRWGLTVSAEFARQAKRDLVPYVDFTQKG